MRIDTPTCSSNHDDIQGETTDDTGEMDTTGTEETTLGDNTVATRRQLLDDKLSSYKHERKQPIDSHLLSCAKEELALKKR